MSKWNDPPQEVLTMVFKRLHTYDGFAKYQRVCKAWRRPAQKAGLRNVSLNDPLQAERFFRTLADTGLGPVVEKINFYYDPEEAEPFEKIAELCPNIKSIMLSAEPEPVYDYDLEDAETEEPATELLYNVISRERANGRLSKLDDIPGPGRDSTIVEQYYEAALSLGDKFRTVFVTDVGGDESDLWKNLKNLTHVESLCYETPKRDQLFRLDQLLKKCPKKLKDIRVHFTGYRESKKVCKRKKIFSYPDVKGLSVSDFQGSSQALTYIMNVFPNLSTFHFDCDSNVYCNDPPLREKMETDVAAELINKIINMKSSFIRFIPVKNPGAVLEKLNCGNRRLETLRVSYLFPYTEGSPYIDLNNKEPNRISMTIRAGQEKPIPRIGLIEDSGENLKNISINYDHLGMADFCETEMDRNDNSYHISDILKKCPNLESIALGNTVLCKFRNLSIPQERSSISKLVSFFGSEIDPTFFSNLSLRVAYIHKLDIRGCRISGQMTNNFIMDMPYTKFDTIMYSGCKGAVTKMFLKLETTFEENKVAYYVGSLPADAEPIRQYGPDQNVDAQECTESDYQNSLDTAESLSVFIQCEDYSKVIVSGRKIKMVIEKA